MGIFSMKNKDSGIYPIIFIRIYVKNKDNVSYPIIFVWIFVYL